MCVSYEAQTAEVSYPKHWMHQRSDAGECQESLTYWKLRKDVKRIQQ